MITPLDNLPSKLVEQLSQISPPQGYDHFEVVNAGCGGYASAQEYLYLVSDLVRYSPDLVIVYDGWNDLNRLGAPRNGLLDPRTLSLGKHVEYSDQLNALYSVEGSLRQFLMALTDESYRFLRGFVSLYMLEKLTLSLLHQPQPDQVQEHGLTMNEVLDSYRTNLERILFTGKQYGFTVALFLQPILGVDGKEPSGQEVVFFNRNQKGIETRRTFFDGAREIFSNLDRKWTDSDSCIQDISGIFAGRKNPLYADSGHLKAAGNEIVSAAIVARLSDCGLFR
ncbi:hypothetical protein JCM17960_11370 [Magnetospira thiophila]